MNEYMYDEETNYDSDKTQLGMRCYSVVLT